MADVVLNPNSEDFNELYGKGIRAYALQDFDTAVMAFSKASEILAKQYNDDLHDSLGDVYLYYGKSLLQLTRKQNNPLGESVIKEVDEDDEEEDGEEDETEETKEDNEDTTTTNEESKKCESKTEDEKGDSVEEVNNEDTEEKEEDLSDLQVAWEVLELAKKIFTKRGDDGLKNLAETLIVLGEISLESNMFVEGIEDMKKGLNIQKEIYGNDSRVVAETYYKIGTSLGSNEQQEAIECFTNCIEYLKNRLKLIENDENNKDEVDEINNLIPEIEEKIADVKNFKEEVVKEISNAIQCNRETTPTTTTATTNGSGSSTSTKANDISHLVKRKRKQEEEPVEEQPTKKPSP